MTNGEKTGGDVVMETDNDRLGFNEDIVCERHGQYHSQALLLSGRRAGLFTYMHKRWKGVFVVVRGTGLICVTEGAFHWSI